MASPDLQPASSQRLGPTSLETDGYHQGPSGRAAEADATQGAHQFYLCTHYGPSRHSGLRRTLDPSIPHADDGPPLTPCRRLPPPASGGAAGLSWNERPAWSAGVPHALLSCVAASGTGGASPASGVGDHPGGRGRGGGAGWSGGAGGLRSSGDDCAGSGCPPLAGGPYTPAYAGCPGGTTSSARGRAARPRGQTSFEGTAEATQAERHGNETPPTTGGWGSAEDPALRWCSTGTPHRPVHAYKCAGRPARFEYALLWAERTSGPHPGGQRPVPDTRSHVECARIFDGGWPRLPAEAHYARRRGLEVGSHGRDAVRRDGFCVPARAWPAVRRTPDEADLAERS